MNVKFVTAQLVELFTRLVKFDSNLGIYHNGVDNDYPERVERHINNSATAKPAAKLYKKYLVGNGFGVELDKVIVNKDKNITLRKFLNKIGLSDAYQNGVFIHLNYNLNFKVISVDVIPFKHCRVGKKDDKDYNGKILVYDNWNGVNGKIEKNKIKSFDVYNPDSKVIQSQIENAGGIQDYKGQIMFFNPEEAIYPLSHIDNVMNDADSEFRAGVFKNLSLRKGFFGKRIVITPPMVDGDLRKPETELSDSEREEKRLAESERENFKANMQSFIGADNVDGMLHLEMEFEGDDIEKSIKFIDVQTNINDKLFEYTEKSSSNNIRKAYGNIPSILIENPESSVFGQSGQMLTNAKIFYQEQTEENRDQLENEILNPIMGIFEGFEMPTGGLKIIPLIDVSIKTTEDAVNK